MAITNATINRLNKLSSILGSAGNAVVDGMQSESDRKLSNAGSLISTYYTDSNTGRVAETINTSTRETLQENMQKLQNEIGELDAATAKQKIVGLGDYDDEYVNNALKTFKSNAGTYLASSYIQGQSALEQQYKSNAFTAFDNYYKNAYSSYAIDAQNLGDITNASENFDKIFDDATVDTMIASGYVSASYKEDYETFLEEYKERYKEKWAMNNILYTKAMQESQITSDFTNGLTADFTIDHATSTFITTTTDKDGKETVTYNTTDGAAAYAKAKELYDDRYGATGMSIADPNGLRKSGTKTGDTVIWTYTADSWLYNYGYYTADNSDWLNGDMEATAREWAESFLSSTSLSADEQKILVGQWISSNFDSSGEPVDGGQIAVGLAQAPQDSTSKLSKFVAEVDASSFGSSPIAEDMLAKLGEYGLSMDNVYDQQNIANYMSAVWGFSVPTSDLTYMDEISVCREALAEIPHTDITGYTYGEETYNGETLRTNYHEQIEKLFNAYCEQNDIKEPSAEYRFGFFKAMNNAVLAGTMELSSSMSATLQDVADTMTYDEYLAYCANLRVEGKLPTYYAYKQALALAPVKEYKTEQTTTESMIKDALKQALGSDASSYFMSGVDRYPAIRREINEKLVELGGDINGTEFADWVKQYSENLISAYSADFIAKKFNEIVKEMTGYRDAKTTEASTIISDDLSKVFYQYKLGNYDGIVDEKAVSNVLASLTGVETTPKYEDVRDIAYKTIYPNGEGFDKATDEEKANTLLAVELATLTAEEQRRVETVFGSYFNSPVISVNFEGGKQAYLLSSGNNETMVVWNESVYDNTYMVGLLRGERSIDDYDSTKGGTRTYLSFDDIASYDMFQRTASGAIDLTVREDYEAVDKTTGEAVQIDEGVVSSAYKWATAENKYPKVGDIIQYMSDNVENIDSIVAGFKQAVQKTGYLYQIYPDPYTALDELAYQVKAKNKTVETRTVYRTLGRDGNFQSVLQKIGHEGKGVAF